MKTITLLAAFPLAVVAAASPSDEPSFGDVVHHLRSALPVEIGGCELSFAPIHPEAEVALNGQAATSLQGFGRIARMGELVGNMSWQFGTRRARVYVVFFEDPQSLEEWKRSGFLEDRTLFGPGYVLVCNAPDRAASTRDASGLERELRTAVARVMGRG